MVLAVQVLSGRTVFQMLCLPSSATEADVRQGIRLAMRLLHPDLAINIALKGTPECARIEAAFKKVNNLKDTRIESFFAGETPT